VGTFDPKRGRVLARALVSKPDGAKVRDARVEGDEESDAEDSEDANRARAKVPVERAEESVEEGPKEVVRRRGRERNKSKVSGLEDVLSVVETCEGYEYYSR
jgi:hypothetical protein